MGEPSLHGFKAESGTGELKMGSLGEGGSESLQEKADGIRSHPQLPQQLLPKNP